MVFKLKIDYYHILYLIVFRLRKRCKSANKTSHLFDNCFPILDCSANFYFLLCSVGVYLVVLIIGSVAG